MIGTIERVLSDVDGTAGVVFGDIGTSEETAINADDRFGAASIFKLPTLWSFFKRCQDV